MKTKIFSVLLMAGVALSARSGAQMIFTEGFNSSTLPADWSTQLVAGTAASIDFVVTSTHPAGFTPYEGSQFVRFNSYSAGAGQQIRLLRKTAFSTHGFGVILLDFAWTHDPQFVGNLDAVTVQVSTNGSDWVSASTITRPGASAQWQRQVVQLPPLAQNQDIVFIALLFTSQFGNDCHLDYVRVAGYPSVPGMPVWSQLPDMDGIGYASQLATNDPFEARMADDFQFDAPIQPVKYMQWWCGMQADTTGIYAWNIYIYSHRSASNAPGAVVWQWTNIPTNLCHETTNVFNAGTRSYWVELPYPLLFPTGQHYWITFQPCLFFPPQSFWLATPQAVRLCTGALQFALLGISNWTAWSECAFTLLGDPGLLLPRQTWQRVIPGATAAHLLTLTNTTGSADSFSLTAVPDAWGVAPLPAAVPLAAGAATSLTVTVLCPDGAAPGIVETTRVTATSLANAGIFSQADLQSMSYLECPGLSVWAQAPDFYNGIISTLITNPSGMDARTADDFLFAAPPADPILYLRWWDARFSFAKPQAWNLYLYAHDPALCVPTNLIAVWYVDGANVFWSKLSNTSLFFECWTELTPPFVPVTGQHYWLTIQAAGPLGMASTYWATRSPDVTLCTGGYRNAAYGVTNWIPYPGFPSDFAFELRVVPEPAALIAGAALLGLIALAVARRPGAP
jgi:hypothetical protein